MIARARDGVEVAVQACNGALGDGRGKAAQSCATLRAL
jgi:hypothetical protein